MKENDNMSDNQTNSTQCNSSSSDNVKNAIYFKFSKGSSNAVRRSVTISEFL